MDASPSFWPTYRRISQLAAQPSRDPIADVQAAMVQAATFARKYVRWVQRMAVPYVVAVCLAVAGALQSGHVSLAILFIGFASCVAFAGSYPLLILASAMNSASKKYPELTQDFITWPLRFLTSVLLATLFASSYCFVFGYDENPRLLLLWLAALVAMGCGVSLGLIAVPSHLKKWVVYLPFVVFMLVAFGTRFPRTAEALRKGKGQIDTWLSKAITSVPLEVSFSCGTPIPFRDMQTGDFIVWYYTDSPGNYRFFETSGYYGSRALELADEDAEFSAINEWHQHKCAREQKTREDAAAAKERSDQMARENREAEQEKARREADERDKSAAAARRQSELDSINAAEQAKLEAARIAERERLAEAARRIDAESAKLLAAEKARSEEAARLAAVESAKLKADAVRAEYLRQLVADSGSRVAHIQEVVNSTTVTVATTVVDECLHDLLSSHQVAFLDPTRASVDDLHKLNIPFVAFTATVVEARLREPPKDFGDGTRLTEVLVTIRLRALNAIGREIWAEELRGKETHLSETIKNSEVVTLVESAIRAVFKDHAKQSTIHTTFEATKQPS